MAIYHFSVKLISRAQGRSAVAAAAYRSGAKLRDERQDRSHDYRSKQDVIHSEILLPKGASERLADRERLWNLVEAAEKRKDAQVAREVEFALPRELSRDQGIALARAFVARQFVAKGMIADLNIHWPTDDKGRAQPHAHVMLTTRSIAGETFGPKVRAWNMVSDLQQWRENWAKSTNARLARFGQDIRIDHRSLHAQGIDLEPQGKIGPAAKRRDRRGEVAERVAEHRAIAQRNGERIAAEPGIALRAITHGQATFTRADLARFLHRHSDSPEQFAQVLAKVEASPELIRLGSDRRGETRYTTRDMLDAELRLARSADELAGSRRHGVDARHLEAALRRHALGTEQADALEHVTAAGGIAVVKGVAGSGKSRMLAAAREAWERQGYHVSGATLSGIAAESLEASSGIASRTLASLEHAWGQGYDRLGPRDVLVIDEAGLVGTRQLERVIGAAREVQAKVVLVGDPEQLQAIEAGAAFRMLSQRHGAAEITKVQRQRVGWQKTATVELATGQTGEGLRRYFEAGAIIPHGTPEVAARALVDRWAAQADRGSSIILAYTRDDVRHLNELARERMRSDGKLGSDIEVMTARGERRMASGDRVMFLRNERSLGVRNGTLGRIEQVDEQRVTVVLDGHERRVSFDWKDYAHLDHGYASTIHKAQGVTVDRSFLLASPFMDRHAAYVGLTRHRDHAELHYARSDFADTARLVRTLSRERAKDMALDHLADVRPLEAKQPAASPLERPLHAQMAELIAVPPSRDRRTNRNPEQEIRVMSKREQTPTRTGAGPNGHQRDAGTNQASAGELAELSRTMAALGRGSAPQPSQQDRSPADDRGRPVLSLRFDRAGADDEGAGFGRSRERGRRDLERGDGLEL